jgi:hypothetical protein
MPPDPDANSNQNDQNSAWKVWREWKCQKWARIPKKLSAASCIGDGTHGCGCPSPGRKEVMERRRENLEKN